MKTLEKGQEKIKKICSLLHDETIEPAQKEAQAIIQQAHQQAEQIIASAQKAAEKLKSDAAIFIEQGRIAFESSLQQAAKQSVETLRQSIEHRFFSEHLSAILDKDLADPKIIANLINTVIKALEKEGLATNLSVVVSKTVSPRQINELLTQDAIKSLKENAVGVGNFAGGARIKLNNKNVTIDISDEALKELLATHVVRKDFRKMLFAH